MHIICYSAGTVIAIHYTERTLVTTLLYLRFKYYISKLNIVDKAHAVKGKGLSGYFYIKLGCMYNHELVDIYKDSLVYLSYLIFYASIITCIRMWPNFYSMLIHNKTMFLIDWLFVFFFFVNNDLNLNVTQPKRCHSAAPAWLPRKYPQEPWSAINN